MEKCRKCGYESKDNRKIKEKEIYLCSICKKFVPSDDKLEEYLKEKIDWKSLEGFRRFSEKENKNIFGMKKKAEQGQIVSRAAFGYSIIDKKLISDPEKSLIVQKIFTDFLNENISLSHLAGRHGFSVNGLKKILRNFTYIGKVKFNGQVLQGNHQAIISPELFNKVQNKLESLGIS
jgi:hypothetical protein